MIEQKNKYGEDAITGSTGDWRQKKQLDSGLPSNDKTVEDLLAGGIDTKTTYVRDSNVTFLDTPGLYDIVWPFIKAANKNAGWNFDWDYTEEMQFTKYGMNQFYGWHTDSASFIIRIFWIKWAVNIYIMKKCLYLIAANSRIKPIAPVIDFATSIYYCISGILSSKCIWFNVHTPTIIRGFLQIIIPETYS